MFDVTTVTEARQRRLEYLLEDAAMGRSKGIKVVLLLQIKELRKVIGIFLNEERQMQRIIYWKESGKLIQITMNLRYLLNTKELKMRMKVSNLRVKQEELKLEVFMNNLFRGIILIYISFIGFNLRAQSENELALLSKKKEGYERIVEGYLKEFYADGSYAYSVSMIRGEFQDSLIRYRLNEGDFEGFVMGEYEGYEVSLMKAKYSNVVSTLYSLKTDTSFNLLYQIGKLNSSFSIVISSQSIYSYNQRRLIDSIYLPDFISDTVMSYPICDVVVAHSCPGINQIKFVLKYEGFSSIIFVINIDDIEDNSVATGDFEYYFNIPSSEYPLAGISNQVRYVNNEIESIKYYDMFSGDLGLTELERFFESQRGFIPKMAIGVGRYTLIERSLDKDPDESLNQIEVIGEDDEDVDEVDSSERRVDVISKY